MTVEISNLIVSSPEIRHGKPRIVDTGITVHRLAIWYKLGHSPEEIACQYRHLTLAQVYAGLAYYHANREKIDAEIAAEAAQAEQLEQEFLQKRRVPS